MKCAKLAVGLLCGLPLLAWGDTPATTQPSAAPAVVTPPPPPGAVSPDNGMSGPSMDGPMGFRRRWGENSPGTSAVREWDDMLTFMDQHSPNRAKLLRDIAPRAGSTLRAQALQRWRTLQALKSQAPQMYDFHVKRFELEDEIFGLVLQIRQDPGKAESLRSEVRQKAQEMVRLSTEERKQRIARLNEMLANEKQMLEQETQHADQLVNQRVEQIMRRAEKPADEGTTSEQRSKPDNSSDQTDAPQ